MFPTISGQLPFGFVEGCEIIFEFKSLECLVTDFVAALLASSLRRVSASASLSLAGLDFGLRLCQVSLLAHKVLCLVSALKVAV